MRKYSLVLWIMLLCLCLSACAPFAPMTEPVPEATKEGLLRVHIIDVGQGDSTLIELPDGTTLLIDAGERDYGETVVDYLHTEKVEKIDYLIGTHPHSDHIGGLREVVENFDIGQVYMPKKASTTATFENLLKAIKAKGLSVISAKAGKMITEGENFSVEILSPVEENYGDEMNLYSVVVRVTYGKRRFLFMGDAETENEEQMPDVRADFIRVGHHGSRTSSGTEFVNRVGAQIAVVSVGEDNSYGLPKKEILERWTNAGARLYRTDREGSLLFECDGSTITKGDVVFDQTAQVETANKWVLNISTKKIHYPDCSGVSAMKKENKMESDKTIAELTAEGYTLCGTCDPVEG